MLRCDENGVPIPESENESAAFFAREDRIHFAIFSIWPNVASCVRFLEEEHYTPCTPRNALFEMRCLVWNDLLWFIVSIPLNERTLMENVAAMFGFKINTSQVCVIHADGVERFPLQHDNLYMLTNDSKFFTDNRVH